MTDKELIERCKHGDRDAFTEIMQKHQNLVFGMAYNILSDYQDAEDAAQDTFIKAYKSISSFKGDSAFTTWLYVICRNSCNDILRKRQKHSVVTSIDTDDTDDGPIKEIKSDAPTPEEKVELSETQALVREAINSLKPEYKEVLVLSDIQQLSYDEVSAILKIPNGTVKSRLNRARNALRKKLSDKRELFS
ncbi:MAG: sigma-70 family RNA polymerase sigma factor [Clostridia bacterium]|nr:sigma-70 family RNA polymerase sigma factor [Clostridia bacterium]